jgi:hypothetical protein
MLSLQAEFVIFAGFKAATQPLQSGKQTERAVIPGPVIASL